jgi:hypothetical protein
LGKGVKWGKDFVEKRGELIEKQRIGIISTTLDTTKIGFDN